MCGRSQQIPGCGLGDGFVRLKERQSLQVLANLGQEIAQLGGGEVADSVDDAVVTEDDVDLPLFTEVPGAPQRSAALFPASCMPTGDVVPLQLLYIHLSF